MGSVEKAEKQVYSSLSSSSFSSSSSFPLSAFSNITVPSVVLLIFSLRGCEWRPACLKNAQAWCELLLGILPE